MSASEIDQFNSLSKEALNRFIYIIGAARGGTTIIRNAIGLHDNILMLPGMTHFMNQVWRYRKKVHNRLLRQIFRMPPFYGESEALKSLSERSDFNKHLDGTLKGHNLRHMWQIYPLVYGLDKKNTKRPDQILCWGDKANDFYGIETVRRYFPKGKFIFVVRDPRAAVLSLARRALRKEEHRIVAEVDEVKLIEASIHWRNMIQRMAYFSGRHPDRTIIVKFEDFLMTPEATLNRIFRFTVGVPMDHDVIEKRLRGLS
ncbi:MAG: sulfotransferase, partial [Thermodesulfobacteriota bacterium]|nr:sulfotransferase [Thermodesulfobacteriota bacterium]